MKEMKESMKQASARKAAVEGFTLIEVMIVVVIIAILAAIAIPSYSRYIARSKLAEAVSELSSYRVRMEQWFQDARTYQDSAGSACGATTVSNAKYFTFECSAPTSTTYTVTATGTDAALIDMVLTIDQDNTKKTVSVPSGWTAPSSNCWVTSQSGSC